MNVQVISAPGTSVRVCEVIGSDGRRVINVKISRKIATAKQSGGMRLAEFCTRSGIDKNTYRSMRKDNRLPWSNRQAISPNGGQEMFVEWQVRALQMMLRVAKLGVSHHAAAMAVRQGKGEALEAMLSSIIDGQASAVMENNDVQE